MTGGTIPTNLETFEQTGEIPEDEGIRINQARPSRVSSAIATSTSTSTKKPTKRIKKARSVNPASLLTKGDKPAADVNSTTVATISDGHDAAPSGANNTSQAPSPRPATTLGTPPPTNPNPITQTKSPVEVSKPVDPPDSQSAPEASHGANSGSADVNGDEHHHSEETQLLGSGLEPTPGNDHNDTSQASQLPSSSQPNPSASGVGGTTGSSTSLTILQSTNVRMSVTAIDHVVGGVKPNWERYKTTWEALSNLALFQAQSLQSPGPHEPHLHFERTTCSYAAWIKTIASVADDFLAPSPNDQWNCPDVVDFPLISVFSEREKTGSSNPFISPTVKSKHPESTIIRFLHRLQSPPATVITDWAKVVAASVEVMAFKLYNPPPPTPDTNHDTLTQGLQVLEWAEGLKKSLSTYETPPDSQPTSAAPDVEIILRSHAIDVLTDFAKTIIDVFMGYVIFQVHALSGPPLTNSQLQQQSRAKKASGNSSVSNPSALNSTSQDSPVKANKAATRRLQLFQSRHNFQPLTYFVLGGVRGLFIASKNYRHTPVSECMSFIQSMAVITQHSKVPRTPEEPIWKNLSAYLLQIFQPAFQSPGKILPLQKKPDPHELAQAITVDFLTHWRTKQPTSPFLIPQAPHQITNK
ncbi:hypothetical protein PtB15_1B364 [Puccinia triticina]|nr:hypothetical protein PtB15_1B364 [Puccinia triticina]